MVLLIGHIALPPRHAQQLKPCSTQSQRDPSKQTSTLVAPLVALTQGHDRAGNEGDGGHAGGGAGGGRAGSGGGDGG